MLDHGHGVTSVYSHLSKILVKVNENIKKGGYYEFDWINRKINWASSRLAYKLV